MKTDVEIERDSCEKIAIDLANALYDLVKLSSNQDEKYNLLKQMNQCIFIADKIHARNYILSIKDENTNL